MIKFEAMNQFGYSSQDAFDTMLLDLSIDPDKTDFTESECDQIRQHIASMGATKALPTGDFDSTFGKSDNAVKNGHLAVTDDEILDIAANTGVELDVLMNAAAHVADLEALVRWVEIYKELEDEQAIRESAKEQFEIDQLRKKESQLGDRLNTALEKPSINTNLIRERLGVKVPQTVTELGKWDGKVGSKNEPGFLKSVRAKVAEAGIGRNQK